MHIKCLFATLCLLPVCVQAETIRLASGEWAPYQSAKLPHHGFISKIISDIFIKEGVKVEYAYFPWKRTLELTAQGDFDGTFLWFKTPEREKLFYYSDPLIDVTYNLYQLKDAQIKWQTLDELKGRRIGVTLGYSYGKAFDAKVNDGVLTVERVSTDLKNFRKLLGGRIDLFPCESRVAEAMARSYLTADQIARITVNPKPLTSEPHYLLMPRQLPQSKTLIARFNAGLKKMKADGHFEKYVRALPEFKSSPKKEEK